MCQARFVQPLWAALRTSSPCCLKETSLEVKRACVCLLGHYNLSKMCVMSHCAFKWQNMVETATKHFQPKCWLLILCSADVLTNTLIRSLIVKCYPSYIAYIALHSTWFLFSILKNCNSYKMYSFVHLKFWKYRKKQTFFYRIFYSVVDYFFNPSLGQLWTELTSGLD